MEKTVLYCPNKHILAKKHSIKVHLGRDGEKATHKKLPKMLIDCISPGRKRLLIRLLMNERQLKTTEWGNFCCLWALWKVNGRENDLNIMNMMGRMQSQIQEIFVLRLLNLLCPKVQRLCLWPFCAQWGFGNWEIVIHYRSWGIYFASKDWRSTALFSLIFKWGIFSLPWHL